MACCFMVPSIAMARTQTREKVEKEWILKLIKVFLSSLGLRERRCRIGALAAAAQHALSSRLWQRPRNARNPNKY